MNYLNSFLESVSDSMIKYILVELSDEGYDIDITRSKEKLRYREKPGNTDVIIIMHPPVSKKSNNDINNFQSSISHLDNYMSSEGYTKKESIFIGKRFCITYKQSPLELMRSKTKKY